MFNFGIITFNRNLEFGKYNNNFNIYFNEYYTAMDFYTKVLENINYKYKVTITRYDNSIPYLKKTKKETKYYNKINKLSKNIKICIKIWFKNDRFSVKELECRIKDYSYNNKFYLLYKKRDNNNISDIRIAVFNGLTDELDKMIIKDIKTEEMF